jgi:hypothetical protein
VALRFTFYAGMDIGRDNGMTVDAAYRDKAPNAFTGTVKRVVFDLKPQSVARGREKAARDSPPRGRRGGHGGGS